MTEKRRVLMVCLGNICRSPMAEAVFAKVVNEKGLEDKWDVDSAGLIDYHTGRGIDRRAREALTNNGVTNYSHKARPIKDDDFDKFDWIFGMDEDNIEELNKRKPNKSKAAIELLGKFDPEGDTIIRDPYYASDSKDFYTVYEQCDRSVKAFLEKHQK